MIELCCAMCTANFIVSYVLWWLYLKAHCRYPNCITSWAWKFQGWENRKLHILFLMNSACKAIAYFWWWPFSRPWICRHTHTYAHADMQVEEKWSIASRLLMAEWNEGNAQQHLQNEQSNDYKNNGVCVHCIQCAVHMQWIEGKTVCKLRAHGKKCPNLLTRFGLFTFHWFSRFIFVILISICHESSAQKVSTHNTQYNVKCTIFQLYSVLYAITTVWQIERWKPMVKLQFSNYVAYYVLAQY